jgi:hypothetical protein
MLSMTEYTYWMVTTFYLGTRTASELTVAPKLYRIRQNEAGIFYHQYTSHSGDQCLSKISYGVPLHLALINDFSIYVKNREKDKMIEHVFQLMPHEIQIAEECLGAEKFGTWD